MLRNLQRSFFLALALAWAAGGRAAAYDSFRPGAEWLDTEGRPIQAHEGSIIVVDGVYYWYGQNKEKPDGVSPVWHLGINLYSSRDLYNWKYEGVTIRPDPDIRSLRCIRMRIWSVRTLSSMRRRTSSSAG